MHYGVVPNAISFIIQKHLTVQIFKGKCKFSGSSLSFAPADACLCTCIWHDSVVHALIQAVGAERGSNVSRCTSSPALQGALSAGLLSGEGCMATIKYGLKQEPCKLPPPHEQVTKGEGSFAF